MDEFLQEMNSFIKKGKRLRLCTVALLIFTTLFVLYLCYMQRWALAVFNLLCCLYAIKLIFDITDDLKDASADKIRMEFCIDVLGRNDEKTEL